MKRILLFLLLFTCHSSFARIVKIGLFGGSNPSSVIFAVNTGNYILYADGNKIAPLSANVLYQVISEDDSILVKETGNVVTRCKTLSFIGTDSSVFKVKSISPDRPLKSFDGNLFISLVNKNLQLITEVNMEDYIAGVIESEVGIKSTPEYYKTQAIICRTYALTHLRRHETEGFNLCDRVHCQVYKAKSKGNKEIVKAVLATEGLVIVDDKLKLITAAFHSNCGGQTVNSEDAWNKPLSYLKSIKDTFCTSQNNAVWKKEIPFTTYKNYIEEKCKAASDSNYISLACNYNPNGRESYLINKNSGLLLKNVRTDLNLKSAFFSVSKVDDMVVLSGRGYGHGVGLCQEGAMRMAKKGYSYQQILHFYYTDIHIVHLNNLDYFIE